MKPIAGISIAVLTLTTACAGAKTSAPQNPAPVPWMGDTLLAPILNVEFVGLPQMAKADSIASLLEGGKFDERLGLIVADTMVPPLIRSNALMLLSDRRIQNLEPFLAALESSDDRVRASAIVGLRPFLGSWKAAQLLVQKALADPSRLVQTKALETLGDVDPEVLRRYTRTATDPALRKIAQDLIGAAEERGAGVATADSSGRIDRMSGSGHLIRFVPVTVWPRWGAVGELHVGKPGATLTRISDRVEAVANVVPAFITPEGEQLVFEADRRIHVQDLKTGARRTVGPGIAPRLLPFSESFVFLRQTETVPSPAGASIRYDVVRANFADATEKVLGRVTAAVTMDRHGNYSPVRWMRVRDSEGQFFLMGDNMDPFRLPSPFAK